MTRVRPPVLPKDTSQSSRRRPLIWERRRAFQKLFEADVRALREPLYQARSLLQDIELVLERIKRLR